jgi:intein/homing endonuclease
MRFQKYPSTFHLPWSREITSNDKVMPDTNSFEGREVVITEKMDGECFPAPTRILLADGTTKTIGQIVNNNLIGLKIKGVDSGGNVVDTKITNVFNNGKNEGDWVKLYVRTPNGGPCRTLYTTEDHVLFKSNFSEAMVKDLSVGDELLFNKTEPDLSEEQFQVILGKLLGDASIRENYGKWLVQFTHKTEHEEYVKWTNSYLGNISRNKLINETSGYGTNMTKTWTRSLLTIKEKFSFMYKDEKKIVPTEIIDVISPLAIAFWFMDDGSRLSHYKQQDRFTFSTCSFDNESCLNLIRALDKMGVKSQLKNYSGYNYICGNKDSFKKLSKLIAPYVCDVMKYKLLPEHRNIPNYKLESENLFKNYTVPVKIKEIKKCKHHYTVNNKYDIETETHNYFADNILVHNCTTLYRNKVHARSLDSVNHPSRNWVKNFWGQIQHNIPDGIRICGENCYAKHSIFYTDLESYFLGFNAWKDNTCLSWTSTLDLFNILGITPVPVLYEGIWDEDIAVEMAESMDLNKFEGYVVRVTDSFELHEFNSVVGKFVRQGHVQTDEHWMKQAVTPNLLGSIDL